MLLPTNRDSRLVEYRGFIPTSAGSRREGGNDPDKYDRDCYGIAEEQYHYETLDGFVGDEQWQPKISEAVESLNLERAMEDHVSDTVVEQLESLGYA
ncbi:hypothetical protein BG842_24225 [Haladaptatus sp. W1]|nr:hypothetical protein BG842_24225 [Haladaptatus sp. W1]